MKRFMVALAVLAAGVMGGAVSRLSASTASERGGAITQVIVFTMPYIQSAPAPQPDNVPFVIPGTSFKVPVSANTRGIITVDDPLLDWDILCGGAHGDGAAEERFIDVDGTPTAGGSQAQPLEYSAVLGPGIHTVDMRLACSAANTSDFYNTIPAHVRIQLIRIS